MILSKEKMKIKNPFHLIRRNHSRNWFRLFVCWGSQALGFTGEALFEFHTLKVWDEKKHLGLSAGFSSISSCFIIFGRNAIKGFKWNRKARMWIESYQESHFGNGMAIFCQQFCCCFQARFFHVTFWGSSRTMRRIGDIRNIVTGLVWYLQIKQRFKLIFWKRTITFTLSNWIVGYGRYLVNFDLPISTTLASFVASTLVWHRTHHKKDLKNIKQATAQKRDIKYLQRLLRNMVFIYGLVYTNPTIHWQKIKLFAWKKR